MINLKGINVQYLNILSAIRPIPHGPDLPVPEPDGHIEYRSDSKHSDMTVVAGDDTNKPKGDDQPVFLTEVEIINLKRDLNLQRSLHSCWIHVSKRNICMHQEKRSTAIVTVREN